MLFLKNGDLNHTVTTSVHYNQTNMVQHPTTAKG